MEPGQDLMEVLGVVLGVKDIHNAVENLQMVVMELCTVWKHQMMEEEGWQPAKNGLYVGSNLGHVTSIAQLELPKVLLKPRRAIGSQSSHVSCITVLKRPNILLQTVLTVEELGELRLHVRTLGSRRRGTPSRTTPRSNRRDLGRGRRRLGGCRGTS
jgi:hypothetical protein